MSDRWQDELRDLLRREGLHEWFPAVTYGIGDPAAEIIEAVKDGFEAGDGETALREAEADARAQDRKNLRHRIFFAGLRDTLPRTYYGVTDDPWEEVFETLRRLVASSVRVAEVSEEDPADAEEGQTDKELESPETRELARLQGALERLIAEMRSEDSDGVAAHPELHSLASRIERILDPTVIKPTPRIFVGAGSVPIPSETDTHRYLRLPFGVRWCVRCGTMERRGETDRYYLPGQGEVPTEPPCSTTQDESSDHTE